MCKSRFALAVLAASIAGCTSTEPGSATRPSTFGVGSSVAMEVVPAVITARPTSRAVSCPENPPFVGTLSVNIRAGVSAVTLQTVQLKFTDTGGLSAPQITLPAPVPTQQFGSTLVAARAATTFPFSFGFGCGTGRTGTLVVIVVTTDERGRNNVNEMNVKVQ